MLTKKQKSTIVDQINPIELIEAFKALELENSLLAHRNDKLATKVKNQQKEISSIEKKLVEMPALL